MAEYIEYHPLKFWLDPASIAEIVAHIQTYLVNNPINSTTEIETIIHDYLIAHPELIGGVDSVNGLTGEVVLTADNISGGENVTIKDVLDSLQDQIDDIVASIPSDYQQLIDDVSDLKSATNALESHVYYERTVLKAKESVSTTSGTTIGKTESEFNVSIANGDKFVFCASGTNLINKYALYYNEGGSSKRFGTNLSPNTDYEYTASETITSLYAYVGGSDVVGSGTLELKVTQTEYNDDSIDKHITEIEADVAEIESDVTHINQLLPPIESVYFDKEIEMGTTTKTLVWTSGQYYDINTGEINNNSNYSLTSKMPCNNGDLITAYENKGQILFWNGDTFIEYISTSPSAKTPVKIDNNATHYAFNNNDSTKRASVCDVTVFTDVFTEKKETYNAPAKLIYDSTSFVNKKYISTANGEIYEGDNYATWYGAYQLKCLPNHTYRTKTQTQFVFYNDVGVYLSSSIPTIDGNNCTGVKVERDVTTPNNCAFMSINSNSPDEKVYDISYGVYGDVVNQFKLHNKKVVMFGDSITGNYPFGDNYETKVEEFTGAKTFNCGFGGCRMEKNTSPSTLYINPFSMAALSDAITSESADRWDTQDSSVSSFAADRMVRLRLDILKSIDFSNVDIITIAYGTNGIGSTIDNDQNPLDTYTFIGAFRYSVEKILTKYPHMRIVVFTPIYKWYSDTSDDGDTHQIAGQTLLERVEALKEAAEEYKIPCIDLYHTLGINKVNRTGYFGDDDETADGTHINSVGRQQMGRRIAGELNRLF